MSPAQHEAKYAFFEMGLQSHFGLAREDAIEEVQPDCVFQSDSEGQSDPEPIFEFKEALYDQRPAYTLGTTTRSGRAVRLSGKYTDIF